MLTNCEDCNFFNKNGCGVNPQHWKVWIYLHEERLPDETKESIRAISESCRDFEIAKDLATFSAEVKLSLRIWRKIANSRSDEKRDPKWLPLFDVADKVIQQAGASLPREDDIPFE